ncbi:MAG: hypothetical protein JXM79_23180 [Sedimentisphaerales bacterium]|nr:hypothetical protein [Sedimentisphaerales bacterium]
MGFFLRKKTPEYYGLELSKQLKQAMDTIPDALSSIGNQDSLHLKDINKTKLIYELIILIFVGQRLALQLLQKKGGGTNRSLRKEICNALDQYAMELFGNAEEFYDLLEKRGEQYFQLTQSHIEDIRKGNVKGFFESLQFKFVQFCRGGGDEGEAIHIGSFFSSVPLKILASQYWAMGFPQTAEYINEQGI